MIAESVLTMMAVLAPQGPRVDEPTPPLDRVFRTISLRELAVVRSRPKRPPLGTFLEEPGQSKRVGIAMREATVLELDEIVELIRADLGDAADEDGVFIGVVGTELMLAGPPAVVERASAIAKYLEAALIRPIRVTVGLYLADDETPTVVNAAPGALSRITDGLVRIWESTTTTAAANPVALARESSTPFVGDYDVEVAEKSSIADPIVWKMFEGVRVVVVPHAMVGSDELVAHVQLAVGQRRGNLEARATGNPEFATIDVPLVENNCALISGRVQSGGSLLFSTGGAAFGGSRLVVAVTCEHAGEAVERTGALRLYPASSLVERPLWAWLESGHDGEGSDSPLPVRVPDGLNQGSGGMDPSFLIDFARDALGEKADQEGTEIYGVRSFLAVRGDAEVHALVGSLFTRFERSWLRNSKVVIETRSGNSSLHRIVFPALIGSPHFAMRGLETTAIRDADVEIASKSAISNPVVDRVFGGILCAIEPYATQTGYGARVRCDLHTFDPGARRPEASGSGTDLYLVRSERSEFYRRGAIESGQKIALGDGPAQPSPLGDAGATRQFVEITVQ